MYTNHTRSNLYRRFCKANLRLVNCNIYRQHFHSNTHNEKRFHITQNSGITEKPNISDYYSKKEIAALFLQPFCIIVAYLLLIWQIFKYSCNIKGIDDLMRTLRWKYRKYQLMRRDDT